MNRQLAEMTLHWTAIDTQIVLVGALTAVACSLVGTFLLLRRMSMMGDAISHAVLPGLALAFLISQSRASLPMMAGAAIVGLLTTAMVQWVHRAGRVDEGASMGVVFTILFAIGLVLLRVSADAVDLDPNCVLYGALEYTPLKKTHLWSWSIPSAVIPIGAVFLLNLFCITLLYKEFKIAAFDPGLATTMGINANLMHYLLMALVALTTVAAFESVGSILVIAMLIVPAATAHLLTDRLSVLLILSALIGAMSALLGHLLALSAPGWLGYADLDTSTAAMMSVAAGLLFCLALVFSPRYGLISRLARRVGLALRVAREDVLLLLHREESAGRDAGAAPAESHVARMSGRAIRLHLHDTIGAAGWTARAALWGLARHGYLERVGDQCALSAAGRAAAERLLSAHVLWEQYLVENLSLPDDHLHSIADRLEHVTDPRLHRTLADSVDLPGSDSGRP